VAKTNADVAQHNQALAEKQKQIDELVAKMDLAQKKEQSLGELLRTKNEIIAQLEGRSKEPDPGMRQDWRVVGIDKTGSTVYVNLGSADKLKPQDTFAIHGVGLDGKVIVRPKGSLEVVNVKGDHLAECRLTNVKDPARDPIVKGDVLYNPAWNPNRPVHVAVAGVIDLTGDGRNSMEEFLRTLRKQGCIIDAYLDPKDFEIKDNEAKVGGALTAKTEFLIEGDSLDVLVDPKARDPQLREKVEKAIGQMRKDANYLGVQPIGLRKYLEKTGYRVPAGVLESGPSRPAGSKDR